MSVVGIAGLFIACPDPARVREWYGRHLGLRFSEGEGAGFFWREPDSGRLAVSQLDFLDETTSSFHPGTQPFMVRYRVRNLGSLADTLRAGGDLTIRHGRVGGIIDPDGQRVELLEADEPPGRSVDHGRVQGIGGVFFRSPDPASLKTWYAKLGIRPGPDGYVTFPASSPDGSETFTAWEIFPSDTTYFDSRGEPSPHPYMLNLRVADLDGLVEGLRTAGVWVDPNIESYDYGKFAWIVDPVGARVELWEPAPPGS
ncbi:VOC family protein [Candidatus Palauibacter sp.]|uniref:VOC family protein n=1 Tax=Candidatus Palauibacter sp. TaxID=3101350 RepID=UPI003B5B3101